MFIVPYDKMLKKKWLGYAGERWRGFKTQLKDEYIKKSNDKEVSPYEKYSYIDNKVWEDFVKSHTTPEFLAKSQNGKEN